MENLTLEQEFELRKNKHKLDTCLNVLVLQLTKEIDDSKEVNIPSFLLKDKIKDEALERVQFAMHNGEFEELYENSWSIAKDILK